MKFFTNKSIWSKIIIVLIFVLVFEFIVAKPSLGASEVTDNIVEGGGKLLTPVVSLATALGDGLIGIAQDAVLSITESVVPIDTKADFWTILKDIVKIGIVIVAAVATVVGTIATGGTGLLVVGTAIAKGLMAAGIANFIGPIVVDATWSTGSSEKNQASVSVFPDTIKVPSTLYLPIFSLSPEEIFQGKILLFNVDFFGPSKTIEQDDKGNYYYTDEDGNKVITSKQDIAADLSGTISRWYVSIRNIALVAMMIILLYIGIRMLLSTLASDKAKYRQMLQDWLIGLLLLFLMHYIMAFSVTLVQKLTEIVSSSIDENVYAVKFPVDKNGKMVEWFNKNDMTQFLYDSNGDPLGSEDGTTDVNNDDVAYVLYPTNLLGRVRLEMQFDTGGVNYVGYTICYLVLVFFTIYFIFIYLRRVLYMAFLTIIAPMVAMTYPIDKINDGSAQGFTKWFREYIFNLLIQPMHLLLYYILVTSAFNLSGENIIYSIVAIGFMIPAEKLLRSLFGFEKASTPSVLNGATGAALVMGGLSKLSSLGGKGGNSGNKAIGGASAAGGNSGNSSGGDSDDSGPVRQFKNLEGDVDETSEMAKEGLVDNTTQMELQSEQEAISGDQEALDQLKQEAKTPEQKQMIDEEQAEIDKRQKELNAKQQKEQLRIQQEKNEEQAQDKLETQEYSTDNLKQKRKIAGIGKRLNAKTYKMRRRVLSNTINDFKSLPGATIRTAGKIAGTATAATIGVAAGVASGDAGNVLQYGVAGAGAGYIGGKNLGNAASSGIDNAKIMQRRDADADAERGYARLMNRDGYQDIAAMEQIKAHRKEYEQAFLDNGASRSEIKEMRNNGTINRYILNDVSAKDAVTAEKMRKDNPEITQEQAITDAKYAERVGDGYNGKERAKWKEHFSGEFQEKAGLDKKQADKASTATMKRIDRFNKYKKKTI